MRLTTWAAAVGAAVMAAVYSYGSLCAQTQRQVDACEGKGSLPLDTVVSGCTALIQSGNYLGRDLSTVFLTRAAAYSAQASSTAPSATTTGRSGSIRAAPSPTTIAV